MGYIGNFPTAVPLSSNDLNDGIVTTAKIANDAVDNTKLDLTDNYAFTGTVTGAGGGITEADGFRLISDFSSSGAVVSNLERIDDATFSKIGTGMTESSGLFTFPTTGLYMVTANCTFQANSPDLQASVYGQVSTDSGSNYDTVLRVIFGYEASNTKFETNAQSSYVNVTNATNFRFRFVTDSFSAGTNINGNTSENYTAFFFIRLGDSI